MRWSRLFDGILLWERVWIFNLWETQVQLAVRNLLWHGGNPMARWSARLGQQENRAQAAQKDRPARPQPKKAPEA